MSNYLAKSNIHGNQYDAGGIPNCSNLHIEIKTISISTGEDISYLDEPCEEVNSAFCLMMTSLCAKGPSFNFVS